jgi:hypothetical protein
VLPAVYKAYLQAVHKSSLIVFGIEGMVHLLYVNGERRVFYGINMTANQAKWILTFYE